MTKFTILIQKDSIEEGGGYSGQCLELQGAISQGETMEESIANTRVFFLSLAIILVSMIIWLFK